MHKSVRDARRFFPTTLLPYALMLLLLLSLALTGADGLAQKPDHVDWLGWLVVAQPEYKPRSGHSGGKKSTLFNSPEMTLKWTTGGWGRRLAPSTKAGGHREQTWPRPP